VPTLPATPPPHLVQPGPPPVLTVMVTGPVYDYQKIDLNMRIDNFPFDELDINQLPFQLGSYRRIPGITYGQKPQRDKNGSVTFGVIGYFINWSERDRANSARRTTTSRSAGCVAPSRSTKTATSEIP
jgi:hypothetical protein